MKSAAVFITLVLLAGIAAAARRRWFGRRTATWPPTRPAGARGGSAAMTLANYNIVWDSPSADPVGFHAHRQRRYRTERLG